jgi:hypothetical protein
MSPSKVAVIVGALLWIPACDKKEDAAASPATSAMPATTASAGVEQERKGREHEHEDGGREHEHEDRQPK